MGTVLELHQKLLDLIPGEDEEVKNVYHQPPKNTAMKYPCLLYVQNEEEVIHADNLPYHRTKRWELTVIDKDPDSVIVDRVAELPMCKWNRTFKVDNLNHTVYNLFF